MEKIVGIGQYVVTNDDGDRLKTYALASCIAVTAYSPLKKTAGMIHVALPSPTSLDSEFKPGYYVTTGVPMLIDILCKDFGCSKNELEIHIYGGADSINENDVFNIGKKNIEVVTNILFNLNLKISKVEVGGTQSRTIEMDVATGNVKVTYRPIRI